MPNNAHAQREVTFITAAGDMMIRMMSPTTNAICEAAISLKASHFVTLDGLSALTNAPIWGVFEMRTAEKDTPVRGEWSIRDPIRTFEFEHHDAAVMFAQHLRKA